MEAVKCNSQPEGELIKKSALRETPPVVKRSVPVSIPIAMISNKDSLMKGTQSTLGKHKLPCAAPPQREAYKLMHHVRPTPRPSLKEVGVVCHIALPVEDKAVQTDRTQTLDEMKLLSFIKNKQISHIQVMGLINAHQLFEKMAEQVKQAKLSAPVKLVELSTPVKPAELSAPFKPAERPVPVKPVELPAPAKAAELLASVKPAKLPTPVKPAERPAPFKPAELPAPFKPAELPAPFKPAELPAPFKPAELPAPFKPAEHPAPFKPAERSAPFKPVERPAPFIPAELSAPFKPAERPAPFKPAELPAPFKLAELPAPAKPAELLTPAKPAELPTPAKPAELPTPAKPAELPTPVKPAELPAPNNEQTRDSNNNRTIDYNVQNIVVEMSDHNKKQLMTERLVNRGVHEAQGHCVVAKDIETDPILDKKIRQQVQRDVLNTLKYLFESGNIDNNVNRPLPAPAAPTDTPVAQPPSPKRPRINNDYNTILATGYPEAHKQSTWPTTSMQAMPMLPPSYSRPFPTAHEVNYNNTMPDSVVAARPMGVDVNHVNLPVHTRMGVPFAGSVVQDYAQPPPVVQELPQAEYQRQRMMEIGYQHQQVHEAQKYHNRLREQRFRAYQQRLPQQRLSQLHSRTREKGLGSYPNTQWSMHHQNLN